MDRDETFARALPLDPGRTALLVVDMQRAFVGGGPGHGMLATVIGGFNREYRVLVVEDAVATLWPEIQRATLDIIRRAYARVLSAKELGDMLRSAP